MKVPVLVRVGLAIVASAMLAALAAAQDQGVKRAETLVKASGATVQAIGDTKLQLLKTMDVYNALLVEAVKDRPKLYKDLQKEMANTERRRQEISRRSATMAVAAQALFTSWETSLGTIQGGDLRKRSEERLAKTRASYAEIGTVGEKASQIYAPVMKTLADHVQYLGHDLNPQAVASLKPEADKLNKKVQELVAAIDETITTANANIGALRPQ